MRQNDGYHQSATQCGGGSTLWLRGDSQGIGESRLGDSFERDGQPQSETWSWIGCME